MLAIRLLRSILLGLAALTAASTGVAQAQSVFPILANPLSAPTALALDKNGTAYVGNVLAGTVVAIAPDGTAQQLASGLTQPVAVVTDGAGNVYALSGPGYITTPQPNIVVKIAPDGTVTTVADGSKGIGFPVALTLDAAGNLYVAGIVTDAAGEHGQIVRVAPDGAASVFVDATHGMVVPDAMVFDAAGNLFVADSDVNRIYEVSPAGTVSIYAPVLGGDDGLAIDAAGTLYVTDTAAGVVLKVGADGTGSVFASGIARPTGIAVDAGGNLIVAAQDADALVKIDRAGNVSPYFSRQPQGPEGLAADSAGNVYVANGMTGTILKRTPAGAVSVLASGFGTPDSLAVDAAGTLYVSDTTADTISKVAPDGTVTIFVTGQDGALALDAAGNLYVSGQDGAFSGAVMKVTPAGSVSVFADVQSVVTPSSLAVDASGTVYAAVATSNIGVDHQPAFIARIAADGTLTDFVQGNYGPLALDAAGNLYLQPQIVNGPYQIVKYAPDGSATTLPNLAFANPFSAMAFDPAGNLLASDASGNQLLEIQLNPSPLASAVLPDARSVQAGSPATIFATLLNGGDAALDHCRVALPGSAPSGLALQYQTTDAATNALTGTVNTPVTLPAKGSQSFVLGFTAPDPLTASGLAPVFLCDGADPAPVTTGVNTVDLLFAAAPVADIIVASATASGDGVVTVPFSKGQGAAFALATYDNGAAATLTAEADTGTARLPITVTLCQTDPATAACLAAPAATVPVSFTNGATPTFSAFVNASAAVPFAPGASRIFVRFVDGSGVSHGTTSVAVMTD